VETQESTASASANIVEVKDIEPSLTADSRDREVVADH
jgi:hypothetical protein